MKTRSHNGTFRGFSLVELLMALAVISMLAAVAIFNFSSIVDQGRDASALRNAQQFRDTYAAPKAAGAQFNAASVTGILEELIAGKRGKGLFSSSEFRLPVDHKEKRAIVKLCEYDAVSGLIALRNP